jgi:hypothetical protein
MGKRGDGASIIFTYYVELFFDLSIYYHLFIYVLMSVFIY